MTAKILIFLQKKQYFAYLGFLGAESESEVRIAKFKMADRIWRPKFQFFTMQIKQNFVYRVFWGAKPETAAKFAKVKMAYENWRTNI